MPSNQYGSLASWVVGMAATLGAAGISHGLVGDDFVYPAGALAGRGAAADGWAGAWAADALWQVAGEKATITPPNAPGINELAQNFAMRDLSTPVSAGTIYFAFDLTARDFGSGNRLNRGAGLNIAFSNNHDNANTIGPMVSVFEWYAPNEFSIPTIYTNIEISLDGAKGNGGPVAMAYTPGQTYRVVGALAFDAVGLDETFSVWIDPAAATDTPAASLSGDLGYSEIGLVRFWQWVYAYSGSQPVDVDNLKIGVSFSEVTGIGTLEGDADGDGDVDLDDFSILSGNFYQNVAGGPQDGDFNNDGVVNMDDYTIQALHFGDTLSEALPLPEPACFSVLLLSVGLFTRRGKRGDEARL